MDYPLRECLCGHALATEGSYFCPGCEVLWDPPAAVAAVDELPGWAHLVLAAIWAAGGDDGVQVGRVKQGRGGPAGHDGRLLGPALFGSSGAGAANRGIERRGQRKLQPDTSPAFGVSMFVLEQKLHSDEWSICRLRPVWVQPGRPLPVESHRHDMHLDRRRETRSHPPFG